MKQSFLFILILSSSCVTKPAKTSDISSTSFCQSDSIRAEFDKNLAFPEDADNDDPTSEFTYRFFETGVFPNFFNQYFSYHLYGLHECPLNSSSCDIYRLLWLRSFDNPVCITISKEENTYLKVKATNGKGGYYSGSLIENKSLIVSDSVWSKFTGLSDSLNFDKFSSYQEVNGGDGEYYVLEKVLNGKYKAVCRWSPELNTDSAAKKIGLLGMYLIDLAKKKSSKL